MSYILFSFVTLFWAAVCEMVGAPNPLSDIWLVVIAILSAGEVIRMGCKK